MDPLRFILLVAFLPFLKLSFAAEEFKTAKGKLIITPINHATLVIEWRGKTIYVDPVGMAGWYKAFPKPDLVLLTHVHGDHFREAVLKAVVGPKTQLVAAPALASVLGKELKAKTIAVANGASTEKVGSGLLTACRIWQSMRMTCA